MQLPPDKTWLSPAEVAKLFHVSPITIRNWANSGKLASETTPGGHRRFSQHDIQAFAESQNKPINIDSPMSGVTKILIVDDDQEVGELLGTLLSLHLPDAQFVFAYGGFEAGFIVGNEQPNLIFMDILMPGIKGGEACKMIKNNPQTKLIPIVGMTGYGTGKDIHSMLEAGAACVIRKPFNLSELYPLVDKLLNTEMVKSL